MIEEIQAHIYGIPSLTQNRLPILSYFFPVKTNLNNSMAEGSEADSLRIIWNCSEAVQRSSETFLSVPTQNLTFPH